MNFECGGKIFENANMREPSICEARNPFQSEYLIGFFINNDFTGPRWMPSSR